MIVTPKTMFIAGNGFDKNLKLNTAYNDFMISDEFKGLLHLNYLIDYLNNLKQEQNWVDIENELTKYSNILFDNIKLDYRKTSGEMNSDLKKSTIEFRLNYEQLCDSLKRYLLRVANDPCIIGGLASDILLKYCDETKRINILTFNYTYTVERIIEQSGKNITYDINHIHGTLKDNIVFGVEDNADIKKDHIFLYKSYNKTQNLSDLNFKFKESERFVFFGYSLGQTDHSYFDAFFREQSTPGCTPREFIFYYHGQESYDDLIWQLKVLTNNNLSKLKQYNNNKLKFIDTK